MSAQEVQYRYALANSLGASTTALIERHRTVAFLHDARRRGMEHVFLEVWREKRAEQMAWLFRTQRKWQDDTRRPGKARHHDSIAIREKYVRCQP